MTKWPIERHRCGGRTWWHRVWVCLCLLSAVAAGRAAGDSVRVSLLTCSPGDLVYELYGHTAIRVQTMEPQRDWVFNYGVFSFTKPHFVWRFVKGETDFELGLLPYGLFVQEYERRGSYVWEQELLLRADEKQRLMSLLWLNLQPENREYRYNFLYNNCSTRARDVIEQCVDGRVEYPAAEPATFRSIIHAYTAGHAWSELGQDLVLGSEVDRPIDARLQHFAPLRYAASLEGASVVGENGVRRPLAAPGHMALPAGRQAAETRGCPVPLLLSVAWLLLTAAIGLAEWRSRKSAWWYDICLFGMQGLAGCVVALLFFASEHPAVGTNWLIVVLNPLPLCYLPFMVWRARSHRFDGYHVAAAAILMIFMLSIPLIPQKIPAAIVVLALNLWLRSASKLYTYYNRYNVRKIGAHE